jgi:hypothetical protein
MATEKEDRFKVTFNLAQHYLKDALDFKNRFDILWERELHKSGRMKSFIDLYMCCECVLKSHYFLLNINNDAKKCYLQARRFSHDIPGLASAASGLVSSDIYEKIGSRFKDLSVSLRYSLDMWETLFEGDNPIYSSTVGNHSWVLETREMCVRLIEMVTPSFSVSYQGSEVIELVALKTEMEKLVNEFIK